MEIKFKRWTYIHRNFFQINNVIEKRHVTIAM